MKQTRGKISQICHDLSRICHDLSYLCQNLSQIMQKLSHGKCRKMLEFGKEALFIIIYYYLYYIYRSFRLKSFFDV